MEKPAPIERRKTKSQSLGPSPTFSRKPIPGLEKAGRKITRVKSGCRTCKARKLKCDEDRPACKRCSASGRVCEGYGIWGGGNARSSPTRPLTATPTRLLLPSTAANASPNERELLEWFRHRTTVKFQSAFGSKFWEVLALRASLQEPAIFHAVLAMSAVHKHITTGAGRDASASGTADGLLKTYQHQRGKAVSKLLEPQPRGLTKAAVRTALIACVIFTNMDFAIGQYESGRTHFHSGIRLLSSLKADLPTNPASPGCCVHEENSDQDDAWIIEVFSRGNLSSSQFGVCYWIPEPVPKTFCKPLPTLFDSVDQARTTLDELLSDTFKLLRQARSGDVFTEFDEGTSAERLEELRGRVKANVKTWLGLYELSLPAFETRLLGSQSRLGLCILPMFHALTTIMVDTCLESDDVMAYDAHKHQFYRIIAAGQDVLRQIQEAHAEGDDTPKPYRELFTFVPDGSWHSPLFFTALHCRVRRLRLHAIKFLYHVPTREFIWNHKIAADIGTEVMNIEQGEDVHPAADDFGIMDLPAERDIANADLPAERRVYRPRVSLHDDPARAVLTYKKDDAFGRSETFTREYDLSHARDAFTRARTPSGMESSMQRQDPLLCART